MNHRQGMDPGSDGSGEGPTQLEGALVARAAGTSAATAPPQHLRAVRRCARCGREGRNAFRPVQMAGGAGLWICSHDGPCTERTRMLRRAASRSAQGRPPQSPIAGFSWDARRACVIGSEPASRRALATALGDLGSIDVECLDLARRTVEMVSARGFGIVVAAVRAGDPVALLGELARRLAGASRRGVAVVVVSRSGDGEMPAIASLVRQTGARRLQHPIDGGSLLAMVDILGGLASAPSTVPERPASQRQLAVTAR